MLFLYLIALKLTGISPRFRRFFWRRSYQSLARRYQAEFWTFMNYGYAFEKSPLVLDEQDEPNRYFIGLYHHVAGAIDLSNKTLLEIGCGRGGGASYIARYLNPANTTAIDLSPAAIAFCRSHDSFPQTQHHNNIVTKVQSIRYYFAL